MTLAAVRLLAAGAAWPTDRYQIAPSQDTLTLAFPGEPGPVDYERFGRFENVGMADYRYEITDREGLARAVGEGIFPNTSVTQDPRYIELQKDGQLDGIHWHFVDKPKAALNFYRWAGAAEDPGVRLFYIATMFERLGKLREAIKAYYAIAVHFPRSVSYTYFRTPWAVGPAALDRLEQILRHHPELHIRWTGGYIKIGQGYGARRLSGPFVVDPGRLLPERETSTAAAPEVDSDVVQTIGGPKVQLRKFSNHHWALYVDSHLFVVRGITYSVTPVGLSPDRGTWNAAQDWQTLDTNKNGLHDGLFEAYVDVNHNGRRDPNERRVGDARLMKELGINTIRAYHHLYDKALFRRLYKEYGFYVLCGDLLGAYATGSGADWWPGTDYRDAGQQERMLESVRSMVQEYKKEPYILMWVLGNENVYGVGNNAGEEPEAYADLVDRAARLIHQLDPTRPVAVANGDILDLDILQRKAPHVDVIGMNAYRGEQGLGRHLFLNVRWLFDKPVLITEYGAPAYAEGYTTAQAEAYQAMYLANNWDDIQAHSAGRGVGNSLGGVLFEWTDEWWKGLNGAPQRHDIVPQFGGPFLDGWSYEEWFGLTSQGDGQGSPFARILRPSYFRLKELWNRSRMNP